MPAYKLHYKTDFQGLPISIENRKGSHRHWYDVGEQKEGVTVMKFPYGYVRGTLGTDGDEVDVYIGKDKASDKVFVITQNKAPDFVKIDEQKVMLGFNSSEQARLAYLAHMNKPKALRSIKEITMSEFKAKLTSHKGKLIKGVLITDLYSVKMGDTIEKSMVETPKSVKKKENGMTTAAEDFDEVNKALSAAIASSIAGRARMDAQRGRWADAQRAFGVVPVDEVPRNAGIAEEQPLIGTARPHVDGEPPPVPVRAIHNEVSPHQTDPVIYKSCTGCGRMHKSLSSCPTCDNRANDEATPIWRR